MNEEKKNGLVHQEDLENLSVEEIVEGFDRGLEIVSKLKAKALKYLKPEDVRDEGGNPYIMESGSIGTIAKGFKMSIVDLRGPTQVRIKHEGTEDEIIFNYFAEASSPGLGTIAVQGVCSTRDKFLGRKGGEFKKHSDINFPSLMQKGITNLRNNAVRHFMGLSNVTWKEIEEYAGFKKSDCGKTDYYGKQKTKDLTPKEKETLEKIKMMAKEVFQGSKEEAQKFYVETTSFTNKEDKKIPGKADPAIWSGPQITKIVYPEIKKRFEAIKQAELNGT